MPGVRIRAIVAGVLLLLAACGDKVRLQRGDMPLPPPPGWGENLGLPPGWRVQEVPTRADADRICRAAGVSPGGDWHARNILNCAIPSQQLVVLTHTDDPVLAKAVRDHEFTHPWGPVHHENQQGWYWPDGRPVQALSPQQAAMMRSMAQAEYQQRLRTFQALQAIGTGATQGR